VIIFIENGCGYQALGQVLAEAIQNHPKINLIHGLTER